MSGVQVRFLGTGDPFGSGGRLQSGVLLDASGGRYLIDCGATTPYALARLGVDPATIDGVLISHWHGDHAGGLPALILDAYLGERDGSTRRLRTGPLVIAGPVGTEEHVKQALRLYKWEVPLGPSDERPFSLVEHVPLRTGAFTRVGPIAVEPFGVVHTPEALGFRLAIDGRTIAYSGDTAWTDALVTMSAGTNLFICQAYTYSIEWPTMLSYQRLLTEQRRLRTRRLILTHLGTEMVARRAEVMLEVAEDGQEIAL